MKHQYSYVILRYMHDIVTGEQLNVGVVVYSPQGKYLAASCRQTYQRLSHAFPGLRGENFRSVLRYFQAEIERTADCLWNGTPVKATAIEDIVGRVLPKDDSSFQWSSPGFGVSTDLQKTLDELFERLIVRYDERAPSTRKTDDDVWQQYKKTLEERRVLKYLKPKTIVTRTDEVEFRHAWKNGVWNCLEPVSFDMVQKGSIRDRAHKIIGQVVSIKGGPEKFKVHLLVGKPSSEEVLDTYEKALLNLQTAAGDTLHVVTEEGAAQFVEQFAKEIETHEQLHLMS